MGLSWGILGALSGRLGGLVGRLQDVLGRLGAEKAKTPKTFKNLRKTNDFLPFGLSWKAFWRRLGASWGLAGPSWGPLGSLRLS